MGRGESPEALRIGDFDSSPYSSSSSSPESSFRELDDVFLQTQTRIWLGEVLQIRLDEQTAVSDLLANGELLFEVSKVVWKMLLTKFSEQICVKAYRNEPVASRKSSGRYTPYSNVDSFLKVCKILGLSGIDLFSPSDVVEKRDTRKVCICIRSLSRKARSEHLRVPDFDMVTYTVTMPTDVVGCIRRSWELPRCSFLNSASYNSCKDSNEKFRQKDTIVNLARNYEMHSEESDGIESNHMAIKSDGLVTKHCYDTTSEMNSASKVSGGAFAGGENGTFAEHTSELHIARTLNKSYCSHCQFGLAESLCMTESVGYLCTQHMEHCPELNMLLSPSSIDSQIHSSGKASPVTIRVKASNEIDGMNLIYDSYSLGYGTSIVEESINAYTPAQSYLSNQFEMSNVICHRSDNSGTVSINRGNDLHDSSSSVGSNCLTSSPGIFENESRRLDEFFNVEESSTASVSSVSGAGLNLFQDDWFSEEDDSKTVQFPESQSKKAGFLNKKTPRGYKLQDILKYETRVHSLTSDFEKAHFCLELEDTSSSTNRFLPCADQSSETGHPADVVSYDNGICMSLVNSDVGYHGDKVSQIESDALENVNCMLSCKSYPAFGFHKWDAKGKVASAMLFNKNGGHGASPGAVSQEVSLEKTLHFTLSKASGDAFWLEDMKSIVQDKDEEICTSCVVNLDPGAKKQQNKLSQELSLRNIMGSTFDDSNTPPNILAVDVSEESSTSSSIEDGSCLQNQEITIGDIGIQGKSIPATVIVDSRSAHHNSVIPAHPKEPTSDENSCLTVECSENGGQKCRQASTYLSDRLHCTEHIDKACSQEANIDGKVDTLAVEDFDATNDARVGTPKGKPQKRQLLKSLVGGTAAFGLLFLFLHFRVPGERKGEPNRESSQIRRGNCREFSSQKGQKADKVNGIYPSGKLKFED